MPRSPGRLKLSPDSLSTTRLYGSGTVAEASLAMRTSAVVRRSRLGRFAHLPANEVLHLHSAFLGVLADRLLVVFDKGLLH